MSLHPHRRYAALSVHTCFRNAALYLHSPYNNAVVRLPTHTHFNRRSAAIDLKNDGRGAPEGRPRPFLSVGYWNE